MSGDVVKELKGCRMGNKFSVLIIVFGCFKCLQLEKDRENGTQDFRDEGMLPKRSASDRKLPMFLLTKAAIL